MTLMKPYAWEYVPARADGALLAKRATAGAFEFVLTDATGAPVDLTGLTVTFYMSRPNPDGATFTTELDGVPATILNAPGGHVRVPYTGPQMDVPVGNHVAECRLADGPAFRIVPGGPFYFRVIVGERLGSVA